MLEKKVKYKNLSENASVASIFFIFSLLLDILSNWLILGHPPQNFLIGFTTIVFLSFIIFILPARWNRRIVAFVLMAIQVVISTVNDVLYKAAGEIFTFEKILLANKGVGAFDWDFVNFGHIAIYLGLYIACVILIIVLPKKIKKWHSTNKQFLALISACMLIGMSMLWGTANYISNNEQTWAAPAQKTYIYSTYGYYGFYITNQIPYLGTLLSNHELTEDEFNEYSLYLENGKTPEKTFMTGISEGNNLLIILAESVDRMGIDPYFTPNLYKLFFQDGLYLENYHSENKTNMSEGMALFGTYGDVKSLAYNHDLAKAMNYISLPSLFKKQAAENGESCEANYFHSLVRDFYSRDKTFVESGFDSLTFAGDVEDEIKRYNKENNEEYDFTTEYFYGFIKDSNFTEFNLEKMIPSDQRFMTAYATIVTHGSYVERGSNKENYEILTSQENKAHLEEMFDYMEMQGFLPRAMDAKTVHGLDSFLYYKAGMMDFDKTIKIIFDRLEETGNLDKTTVVIYPDHNAFYDSLSYNIRGIYERDSQVCPVSAFNMGACIYDQKMIAKYKGENTYTTGATHSNFSSIMDIYPTVCDMFGFDYNANLCYGKSIFNETPHVCMTLKDDKYIFDNNFFYYNQTIPVSKDQNIDDTYFANIVEQIKQKFKIHEALSGDVESFVQIIQNLHQY